MLNQAYQQGIISHAQLIAILELAEEKPLLDKSLVNQQHPQFMMAHLLYYFGGLLAIGAMTLFMTLGFDQYGSTAVMAICICYAIAGSGLARYFYQKNLLIPYSLVLGFILCLVPLFVFALQDSMGIWQKDSHYRDYHQWISWQWLMMEFATLAVGAVMLWRFKRAFLMLPIAVTLWYMSMDIAPFFNGGKLDFDLRRIVSTYFGLLILGLAFWIDVRQDRKIDGQDFAFWLYIVGTLTFWGGLTFHESDSEIAKLGYFAINIVLMFVGILIRRKVFVVFGGMGCCVYIGHLAYQLFKNSMIFPLIMTFVGLGIIMLGIYWQRHQEQIYQSLLKLLPVTTQRLLQKLQTHYD